MNIVLKNVVKKYGNVVAINSIDLDIKSGEIYCLLGPSGSGKTTLINLITGIIKLDSGSILVGDIEVPSTKIIPNIGLMPQNDALYEDLSGFDNLLFFAKLYRVKNAKERCIELLNLFNLFDARKKLVSKYSGGMKRRLSLAIAMLHSPKILLLDEPTVGIDPRLRRSIWEEFNKIANNGTTILLTTHVIDEALKCNRIGMLKDGKLIYDENREYLVKITNNNIEELFF